MKKLLSKWIGAAKRRVSLRIWVEPTHPMLILLKALDWKHLLQIVEEQREKRVKNAAGRKPHTRILLGALIVRIMESCTLRKTQDLIRHYAPARLLCGLRWFNWTPNFRTLSDFEILLGPEGLARITAYVLKVARELGFADIRGLVADTTAQEAAIPYPTEVGLMSSFAKSVQSALAQLKWKVCSTTRQIMYSIVDKMKKLVRQHRLFAKTKAAKKEIEEKLLRLSRRLSGKVATMIASVRGNLHGQKKKACRRLTELQSVFTRLLPQIDYYVRTRKVAKNKIISLFQEPLRSIVRGKSGKKVEFGIKWGINRIRGGYVWPFLLQGNAKGEVDYMLQAIHEHIALFGEPPEEFAYDRGGWSEPHIEAVSDLGVKRVAVAPKGRAPWKVSSRCKARMVAERAHVEGNIETLKRTGFNKPMTKTTPAMIRAGYRAATRSNSTKVMSDAKRTGQGKRAA